MRAAGTIRVMKLCDLSSKAASSRRRPPLHSSDEDLQSLIERAAVRAFETLKPVLEERGKHAGRAIKPADVRACFFP